MAKIPYQQNLQQGNLQFPGLNTGFFLRAAMILYFGAL